MEHPKYKLTIFTATYNRGHLINRLYRSLLRQRYYDFEWLVVDDGSQDNTQQLFKEWIQSNNPFPIRYYKQENRGLICALNRGIELAQGEYLSKIDSDDYVTDDFMEHMSVWIDQIREVEGVYGVSGLSVSSEGVPLKGSWPKIPGGKYYVDATDLDREKYNLDADMTEAWKIDILRKHPFPVWEGEKFAPEQIVFHEIAREGWKIRWFPVAIKVCEYQEGGLTRGASKLVKDNPMGYAMMYNHKLLFHKTFGQRFNDAAQTVALSLYAGKLGYLKDTNSILMTALAFPVGILLGIRRKYQFAKLK